MNVLEAIKVPLEASIISLAIAMPMKAQNIVLFIS